MKNLIKKIKDWFVSKPKKVVPIQKTMVPTPSPVKVRTYSGTFDDMPEEIKIEVNKLMKHFPNLNGPLAPLVNNFINGPSDLETSYTPKPSPFYKAVDGKLEEIEFEEDEDESDWGFEEEDEFPIE